MNKQRKPKIKSDFTTLDNYKYYKQTHTKPVTLNQFRLICNRMNKNLVEKIHEGAVISLPASLGYIGVEESKHDKKRLYFNEEGNIDLEKSVVSTDWKATNELWKEKPELKHKQHIIHENLHTEGKRFRIKWSRIYSNIPILYHYKFVPSRGFKRDLAKFIKNNPNIEYYDF